MKDFKDLKIKELHKRCRELKVVTWNVARMRLKTGWNAEDAISLPIHTCRKHSDFQRKYGMTTEEYCKLHNIKNFKLFRYRLFKGYSVEEASMPAFAGKFKRKGKEQKYHVFYKNRDMRLSDAFVELLKDVGVDCDSKTRMSCIYERMRSKQQNVQQVFNHFVTLYFKKYKR